MRRVRAKGGGGRRGAEAEVKGTPGMRKKGKQRKSRTTRMRMRILRWTGLEGFWKDGVRREGEEGGRGGKKKSEVR